MKIGTADRSEDFHFSSFSKSREKTMVHVASRCAPLFTFALTEMNWMTNSAQRVGQHLTAPSHH